MRFGGGIGVWIESHNEFPERGFEKWHRVQFGV